MAGVVAVTTADRIRAADSYLSARTGCYAYRCERYDAALLAMCGLGLNHESTVFDVGAGMGEFGARMHTGRPARTRWDWDDLEVVEKGIGAYRARYVPIDAAIDGTDLETWVPPRRVEWFVCLEVLEHLQDPGRLLTAMIDHADKGVVISTPNPETVDVLAIDSTHVQPVTREMLEMAGMVVTEESFYGNGPADSLLGVWAP